MTFANNEGLIATSNVNVKARFNDQIRRFSIASSATLAALQAQVRTLFAVAPQSALDLFYKDGDDDLVTMTSDVEVKYALEHAADLLRLELVEKVGLAAPVALPVQLPPAVQAPVQPLPVESPTVAVEPVVPRGRFGKHGGCHARKMWGENAAVCPPGLEQKWERKFGCRRGHHHARPENSNDSCEKMWRKQGKCHKRAEMKSCKEKLSASLVGKREGSLKLAPGTPFVKTWRVRNEGLDWPAGSRLLFVAKKGDQMSGPDSVPIEGPVLNNTEAVISVNLVAPQEFGEYTGVWRMSTAEGKMFGKRLRVSVSVTSSSSSSESEDQVASTGEVDILVSKLQAMGLDVPRRKAERMMMKFEGNAELIAARLLERSQHRAGRHHRGHGCHGQFAHESLSAAHV